MQRYLNTTELTKTLTQTDRENCEKPITINESLQKRVIFNEA